MTLLNKGISFRFVAGAPISSATCCGAVRANATVARSEASRAAVAADAGYVTVAPAHRRRTVKGCMRTYVMHQQLLEHLPVPLAPVLEVGERLVVYRRERSTRLAHRNTIQGTTSQRIFP